MHSRAQAPDASAVRPYRSAPHACCERTKSVVSALVKPGSSAAQHREHMVSRSHPQASTHTGGAARRGSARVRVRRAAAAAWTTLAL